MCNTAVVEATKGLCKYVVPILLDIFLYHVQTILGFISVKVKQSKLPCTIEHKFVLCSSVFVVLFY